MKTATDGLTLPEVKDKPSASEEQPYHPTHRWKKRGCLVLRASTVPRSRTPRICRKCRSSAGKVLGDRAYAYDRPMEQLVLAIKQTLAGTVKAMVQNLLMRDANSLRSVDDLFAYLKRTFQSHDPGPEAWREFYTTRMRRTENAIQFLNRLVELSFVVNASYSPLCRMLTEDDIAARLQHGLPSSLQRALYKHLNHLIEVDKVPDMQPGSLPGVIFKLKRDMHEQTGREIKDAAGKWTGRRLPPRSAHSVVRAGPASENGVATALPARPPSSIQELAPAKRQRKRFDEQKQSITKVQQQLGGKALGAKLTSEERNLCQAHSLCLRCRRYGHDHSGCKMASVMGAPKN
eukprot:scaffold1230_cov350-Pavlova_lutheri.AAC.1